MILALLLPAAQVLVGLRPEAVSLTATDTHRVQTEARVTYVERLGGQSVIGLQTAAGSLIAMEEGFSRLAVGQGVTAHVSLDRAYWFDVKTERRITFES